MQQVEGCDAIPATCSSACAPLLIEYFEGCQGIIEDLAPDERQGFQELYGNCQEVEQATAAMLQDARPAMIFHVLVLSDAAAQQAQMFGGDGGVDQSFGPIKLDPQPAPSPSPAGGAEIAQEFRRVCTTANLTVCVPQCNSLTYGFLLSIEIDGRGTVMTCNKMGVLFSWQGQASLGGYIGSDFDSFLSSVISGAAGTYMLMMTDAEHSAITVDTSVQRGQYLQINGEPALNGAPAWGRGGFEIHARAQLSLTGLTSCARNVDGDVRGITAKSGASFVAQSARLLHHAYIEVGGHADVSGSIILMPPNEGNHWSVK
jgi:hypothetical protein